MLSTTDRTPELTLPKRLILVTALLTGAVLLPSSPSTGQPASSDPVLEQAQLFQAVDGSSPPAAEAGTGIAGQAVQKTRADTWHQAGRTADGVQVGIIGDFDHPWWEDLRRNDELPAPAGTFCYRTNFECSLWTVDSNRREGAAVAEVVHDMAPDAELFLAYPYSSLDLPEVVDWFAAQGVDVIANTLPFHFDGPGDGTGAVDDAIADAVDQGMTWVQSVGDNAGSTNPGAANAVRGSYWRGPWTDEDHDGLLEFAPGDERLGYRCDYVHGLRWDDWAEGADMTDYDVRVYNGRGVEIGTSTRDQAAGTAPPVELAGWDCTGRAERYLEVELVDAGAVAEGDVLEFLVDGTGVEHWVNAGSAASPGADEDVAGALTVGAVAPWNGTTVAVTSSRGTTTDGRTKPELVAASCTLSWAFYDGCFKGADAATAVVAGAAALVVGEGLATTPAEVESWLLANAVVDRGAVGVDNDSGAGELILPSAGPRPRFRPDARIRRGVAGPLVGDNRYSRGAGQALDVSGPGGRPIRVTFSVQNDGTAVDQFEVGGPRAFALVDTSYRAQGRNVTSEVIQGIYRTRRLQPGQSASITMTITPRGRWTPGLILRGSLAARSYTTLVTHDVVRVNIRKT